jgi:hypothetical protein
MAAPYYPRDGFAKYLGSEKPLLDYLGFIRSLAASVEALQAALGDSIGNVMLNEAGDPMLNENGDPMRNEL